MSKFPHLTANGNASSFPNVSNVETYKYDNEINYSRFDNVQMHITLCKVPWDMGEAHVGNRTISGIGNVVYFGSKEKRDAWFDDLEDSECYRFTTKYKELHRDNVINVAIPFDVAARYNYVAISYEPFASSGDLLEYETDTGLDNWYWFIREVEFLSPNTTRLHLLNDAWQTFIYDMDIPYMMLERGHYGMSLVDADTYLNNPIGNCEYLLSPETNEPTAPRIATSTHEYVFNAGTMYAIVITSADPTLNWGSKSDSSWETPTVQNYMQGVPTYYAFAVKTSNFLTFVTNMVSNVPQFAQTVQAICFVDTSLVTIGTSFAFCSTTCYRVSSDYKRAVVHNLDISDFGYDEKYKQIAKLYTYPYAELVITDSDGNETEVRIEDTNGKIELDYCMSLTFPFLRIAGAITSTGKTARRNITFKNIDSHNMPIGGNWHDLLLDLRIPTFGIIESAYKVNDYSTHFDRAQQAYAADNAQSNQNANAANTVSNANVSTAGNSAKTATANAAALADAGYTNDYTQGNTSAANLISGLGQASTIDAQERQGAISAATGIANGVVGAVASGNPVGAAASLGSAAINAASTMASVSVAVGVTAVEGGLSRAQNSASNSIAQSTTSSKASNQTSAQSDITSTENSVISSHASNDAATINANAARDRATVSSAIANQIAQASLGAPELYGSIDDADNATTRPLAVYSNVVTQDDYTIKRCGDDFLRYGYSLNAQIPFNGNWCVMPKFTYWRLSDFWVKGLQIPDMYVDKIRFFLFGGVTVWSNPDEIGNVSIYENV